MTSIINDVVDRLRLMSYPIMHGRIKDDIHSMIGSQIKNISLTGLERRLLIERIVSRYKDAMMAEHEPVGIVAAQTIAENQVQSSLSSHHHAGIRRGAVGFERIEQLTELSNTGLCKIVTSPIVSSDGRMIPMDKTSIYELANTMIGINISDVTTGYRIIEDEPHPSWYELLSRMQAIPSTSIGHRWMRIFFDKDLLYRYRITIPAIASAMTTGLSKSGVVMYPPSSVGMYVDVHIISALSDGRLYRRLGHLLAINISGVSNVSTAYTLYENMLESLTVSQVGDNEYQVSSSASMLIPDFSWRYMLESMIPDAVFSKNEGNRFTSDMDINQVRSLILDVPLKYADVGHEVSYLNEEGEETDPSMATRFYVQFDQDMPDKFPYLEYADLTDVEFNSREEMDTFLLGIMVDRHLFWYIEAICPSINSIFSLPEVDTSRSYTTSPHDCKESLGYLAMRQMIYNEIRENIKVNDVWLKTMVNNITTYKNPVAITRHSIKHDRSEWMTFATFEEVLAWMTRAAFTGETDSLDSISARTIVGQPIAIGRGGDNLKSSNKFSELLKNEEVRREQRKRNSDKKPKTISTSSAEKTTS